MAHNGRRRAPGAWLGPLLLPAVARKKVQGFALTKSLSPFMIAPLAGLFLPKPWQWAFGVLPTFWPLRMVHAFIANEPYAWLYVFGALAVDGLLLWLLWWRFDRVVHR